MSIAVEQQRRERRRRVDMSMTQTCGYRIPCPVAPRFRQRTSAGREDHGASGILSSLFARHDERSPLGTNICHALAAAQIDTLSRQLTQQAVEHRSGAVRVGKKLAVLFFVQVNANLTEECCGLLGGERAQDVANDARGTSPEIPLRHHAIGDVAA